MAGADAADSLGLEVAGARVGAVLRFMVIETGSLWDDIEAYFVRAGRVDRMLVLLLDVRLYSSARLIEDTRIK